LIAWLSGPLEERRIKMSMTCEKDGCKKWKLDGYKHCEDHVGEYLKAKQEETKRDQQWWEDYDRMVECED
jgi:hypothetical protein